LPPKGKKGGIRGGEFLTGAIGKRRERGRFFCRRQRKKREGKGGQRRSPGERTNGFLPFFGKGKGKGRPAYTANIDNKGEKKKRGKSP